MTLHYFAYGSNLHPTRLHERALPVKFVCTVALTGHRLAFHKNGVDNSGKCNLLATRSTTDSVYGAIYELPTQYKSKLDTIEGERYENRLLTLRHQEKKYECFTYSAKQPYIDDCLVPYHWYKQLVVLGAKYLNFPDAYIASIESVASKDDPDEKRRQENDALLRKIGLLVE